MKTVSTIARILLNNADLFYDAPCGPPGGEKALALLREHIGEGGFAFKAPPRATMASALSPEPGKPFGHALITPSDKGGLLVTIGDELAVPGTLILKQEFMTLCLCDHPDEWDEMWDTAMRVMTTGGGFLSPELKKDLEARRAKPIFPCIIQHIHLDGLQLPTFWFTVFDHAARAIVWTWMGMRDEVCPREERR